MIYAYIKYSEKEDDYYIEFFGSVTLSKLRSMGFSIEDEEEYWKGGITGKGAYDELANAKFIPVSETFFYKP